MGRKKTAIYIRVSTDAQFEEGYSVDAQREMLAAYCVSKNIRDYEFYIDGGYTGSNIDRPELTRLIADVKDGKVERVLVYKLDRLSRSQKDTLYLIEDVFNPHGVDFVSLNESMDTSTPLGRLMLGILSAFAQLERENIRERTRMGMRERVKSGLWMGGGRVPFGYDYDRERGILVPNKDAQTVRRIYELYLAGYSAARIAQTVGLKYDKLATQILTRKSNAGYINYNGEEYRGLHEPIISLETYHKAMDLMEERSVRRLHESRHLLTGLVLCGVCGAKMRYRKWGGQGWRLVCYSQYRDKPYLVKDPNCDNARPWASEVEEIVINDLFSLTVKEGDERSEVNTEDVLDMLAGQESEIYKKIKRLYGLYADDGDEALLEVVGELKKQLASLKSSMEREREERAISEKIKNVRGTLRTLKESWEFMTDRERKGVIRSAVERIVVTGEKIELYYKFGDIAPR